MPAGKPGLRHHFFDNNDAGRQTSASGLPGRTVPSPGFTEYNKQYDPDFSRYAIDGRLDPASSSRGADATVDGEREREREHPRLARPFGLAGRNGILDS